MSTAEETIQALIAVLPRLILDVAQETHEAWLDGRTPDVSEASIRDRLEQIARTA